jgi:hypothetical protein
MLIKIRKTSTRVALCAIEGYDSTGATEELLLGNTVNAVPRDVSSDGTRLIANHLSSPSSKSTSEVRVLSSTGITRLPRSYDPFRLPDWPSSYRECGRRDLHQRRISPNDSDPLSYMPCSLLRWIEQVRVGILPCLRGLPQLLGGSASTTSLSRPAQASLELRPARLLARLWRTFVPRLQPSQLPD